MVLDAETFRIARVLAERVPNMRTLMKRDISRGDPLAAPTQTTADRESQVEVLRGPSGGVGLVATEIEELAVQRVNSMIL